MKKNPKIFLAAMLLLSLNVNSQNTFPPNGNVGIGTVDPHFALDVRGTTNLSDDVKLNKNVSVQGKLTIGSGLDAAVIKYVPGTPDFPPMLKFSAPAGSRPFGVGVEGGTMAEDSTPNLSCLTGTGTAIPGFLNTFSQMLSVAYNPTTSANPGGQVLMGHNGINAFIETQGTGANPNNPVNHPGDLFINKNCNRNVLFFSHGAPFGANQTNIVSVDGSFNVRSKMQLGVTGSTFADPFSRFYLYNGVGTNNNAIKIKHGSAGNAGIRIASFNAATAFIVHNGANSTQDGPESFKIESDGQTTITSANTDAFMVRNSSGTVNFKVKSNGETYSRHLKVMVTNFPDYVFEKDYKLMSLNEVEKFYLEHKHLPEVPTAAEVEKNDLDLGEMNKLLLKKIEELTIYMVQQQKEIDALKTSKK